MPLYRGGCALALLSLRRVPCSKMEVECGSESLPHVFAFLNPKTVLLQVEFTIVVPMLLV
jgi:hypothetical protein